MNTNTDWQQYKRKGLSEMRPYQPGEDVSHVSVSDPGRQAGSPKEGDMIARNPKNHADQWLVANKYFHDNLEPAQNAEEQSALEEVAHALEDIEGAARCIVIPAPTTEAILARIAGLKAFLKLK